MSQTAPAQARTGYRRHGGILALLPAFACLAGCTMGELKTSPSGPVAPHPQATSPSGTVTPRAGTAGTIRNTNTLLGQDGIVGLKTGSTQAAGGCILIAAWQEVSGRKTLIVAATFSRPGTAETILPNALQAGHSLVLALDRALAPGAQSGSHDNSEGPPQGPPRAP